MTALYPKGEPVGEVVLKRQEPVPAACLILQADDLVDVDLAFLVNADPALVAIRDGFLVIYGAGRTVTYSVEEWTGRVLRCRKVLDETW